MDCYAGATPDRFCDLIYFGKLLTLLVELARIELATS